MHVLRASEVAAAMTRIMMLRPDRHTADGPVFSVIPHGSVQAFIPLPGVTASFQRPGDTRLDGPVLAGAHTLATLCRVWANGPVAVVPLSNRTLTSHGVILPQLSARLTGISQQLAMALCRAEETAPSMDDPMPARPGGLSLRQHQRRARAATGLTMIATHRLQRLAAARREVLDGAKPLAEIALDHGFGEQSYFTTIYRQWCGFTPGADRARGCGDVVFLQDGQRWSSLPDRLIEVREAPWLLAQDIWLQE